VRDTKIEAEIEAEIDLHGRWSRGGPQRGFLGRSDVAPFRQGKSAVAGVVPLFCCGGFCLSAWTLSQSLDWYNCTTPTMRY
jgi:hypothetical protein